MKNIKLFEFKSISSNDIGPFTAITHQLSEEGKYTLDIKKGRTLVFTNEIICSKESKNSSISIDLAKLKETNSILRLREKNSYVSFSCSTGFLGYTMVIKSKGKIVFNSNKPSKGDLYSFFLLRPAKYLLKTNKTSKDIEINLAYPNISNVGRELSKKTIVISKNSLSKAKLIELVPNQGIIVEFDNDFNYFELNFIQENTPAKNGSVAEQLKRLAKTKIVSRAKKEGRILKRYQFKVKQN